MSQLMWQPRAAPLAVAASHAPHCSAKEASSLGGFAAEIEAGFRALARCRRAALRRLAELGGTRVSGPPSRWNLGRLRSMAVETGADAGGEVGDPMTMVSGGDSGCSLEAVADAVAGAAAGVLGGVDASDGTSTGAGGATSLSARTAACEMLIMSIAPCCDLLSAAGGEAGAGE
jgi:hypothetical protein